METYVYFFWHTACWVVAFIVINFLFVWSMENKTQTQTCVRKHSLTQNPQHMKNDVPLRERKKEDEIRLLLSLYGTYNIQMKLKMCTHTGLWQIQFERLPTAGSAAYWHIHTHSRKFIPSNNINLWMRILYIYTRGGGGVCVHFPCKIKTNKRTEEWFRISNNK